jgi:hypothetical protein
VTRGACGRAVERTGIHKSTGIRKRTGIRKMGNATA